MKNFIQKSVLIKNLFKIIFQFQKNVLRGLHFQKNKPREELITVIKGSILDDGRLKKEIKNIWKLLKICFEPEKLANNSGSQKILLMDF